MNRSTSSSAERRSIFRPEAVKRHAQGREAAVLPRFIAPPTFALLWIVLGTLGLGLLVSWFAQIPQFASGTAVVLGAASSEAEEIVLVAFLPATYLPDLAVGQMIYWQDPVTGERLAHSISAVSSTVMNPATIGQVYPPAVETAVTQPSVIVTATLETAVPGSQAAIHLGALYPVEVAIGTRRILSLLPFVGQLFPDS